MYLDIQLSGYHISNGVRFRLEFSLFTFYFNFHFHLKAYPHFQEGNWIWIGTGETISYTVWAKNEPNGGQGENCVLIHAARKFNYGWIDFQCNAKALEFQGNNYALKPLCQKSFA